MGPVLLRFVQIITALTHPYGVQIGLSLYTVNAWNDLSYFRHVGVVGLHMYNGLVNHFNPLRSEDGLML
jgi:hypothetical protein